MREIIKFYVDLPDNLAGRFPPGRWVDCGA